MIALDCRQIIMEETLLCLRWRISLISSCKQDVFLVEFHEIFLKLSWANCQRVMTAFVRWRWSFLKSNMLSELSTSHPESSSTKLNEFTLHASSKLIFVAMTTERFFELALTLGWTELLMIFTSLYFFFITRPRLIKPSEITSGLLWPMFFVPQWIKI